MCQFFGIQGDLNFGVEFWVIGNGEKMFKNESKILN